MSADWKEKNCLLGSDDYSLVTIYRRFGGTYASIFRFEKQAINQQKELWFLIACFTYPSKLNVE
jgi:hypothetical protein